MNAAQRHIGPSEVTELADLRALAAMLRAAYAGGLAGVEVPLRTSIIRERPFLAFDTMPAYSHDHGLFIAKIGAVCPKPDATEASVNALVVAFDARGMPLATLDGVAITNLKCAAVSAMVTDLCAATDARVMGLIGSGVQARTQLEAACAVRSLERVQVYSRNPAHVRRFIADNQVLAGEVRLVACSSARAAVEGAEIVSTATTSVEPVVAAEDLRGEALHINCFGNHTDASRELPASVLAGAATLVVEDRETAIREAGDLHRRALELEDLVKTDTHQLRRQRTVFASTGHAFLDLVTVHYLLGELGHSLPRKDHDHA